MTLVCSASRTRLLYEMPATLPEQGYELFRNPRGKISLPGNHFCTLVFDSWKMTLGEVVLQHNTKKQRHGLYIFSFVRASVGGQKLAKKKKKVKCTSRRKKLKTKQDLLVVCWYCNGRTTLPNFFYNPQKPGCKRFEGNMFRLLLEPARRCLVYSICRSRR